MKLSRKEKRRNLVNLDSGDVDKSDMTGDIFFNDKLLNEDSGIQIKFLMDIVRTFIGHFL